MPIDGSIYSKETAAMHDRRRGTVLTSWLACAVLALCWSAAFAQEIEERVVEHTLDNGMKLLLMRRTQSPTVALNMYVRVGGVDEPKGETGIAHMLEHMLFKGTKTLGTMDYDAEVPLMAQIDALYEDYDAERQKGDAADTERVEALHQQIEAAQAAAKAIIRSNELDEVYSRNGAQGLNAGTSIDYTRYVVSLPANRLELWMRIESERMRDPVLREFYTERDVVMEERRRRNDTDPDGILYEQFISLAYQAHPYGRPTIGWASDIDRLKRGEAERFFRTHYAPNNSVVAIVGDIDPETVTRQMDHYFGDIPAQEIDAAAITREPDQKGERRVTVEYDAEPRLFIGYHKPTLPSFDDFVFDMISGLLSSGRTSRLYKSLVEDQQVVVGVDTSNGWPGARYDNLFVVQATPRHPNTPGEVEEAIYAELERLMSEPISEHELQKVRNQMEAGFVRGLNSNEGMASQLGYFESMAGSWKYVLTFLDTLGTITEDDVHRVASQYLTKQNRTVATMVSTTPQEDESMMGAAE